MEENLQYFYLTFTLLSANCHSANCCRLDTSLLSAAHQGAERRSARKVTKLITLGNVHSRQLLTAIRVEVVEVKSYTGDEKIPKYLVKICR